MAYRRPRWAVLAARESATAEDVLEPGAAPHRCGHGRGAPVEPDGLAHHVLFLPPVAGAHQGDGDLDRGEVAEQLVHGPGASPGRWARPSKCPVGLGDGAVTPDVVERDQRDEPVVHEPGQRRLAVERVFPGEPDEGLVALDPAVGGVLVPRLVNRRLHLEVTAAVLRLAEGAKSRGNLNARLKGPT
ncbi:hypothetical protein GW17_00052680 [Ensete ventricosum]|nr:hypothetical protein GW17_00052680 [Ensete ventricosum]